MYHLPSRTKIRLSGYDYSWAGVYFITICVNKKIPMLWHNPGEPIDRPAMDIRLPEDIQTYLYNPPLSYIGIAVENGLAGIHTIYPGVFIDDYFIMPDHVHILLKIVGREGRLTHGRPMTAPTQEYVDSNERMKMPTVSNIINQLKGYVTKQVGFSIWQKSFFDHIVRNDVEYVTIVKYIQSNPEVFGEELLRLANIPTDREVTAALLAMFIEKDDVWAIELKQTGRVIGSVGLLEDNTRSRRVIEKCGFTYEGTFRQASRLYDGTVLDDVCYSMTQEEYFNRL